jgi:hypothetical protein
MCDVRNVNEGGSGRMLLTDDTFASTARIERYSAVEFCIVVSALIFKPVA